MPATQGPPTRLNAVSLPGPCPPRTAGPRTRFRPAVVLWTAAVLVATGFLTGCEYSYDEGRSRPDPASSTAAAVPVPAYTVDSLENEPVTEAEIGNWLQEVLPATASEVIHLGAGLLAPGEIRMDNAQDLPVGTYALALACRSQRRVTFTVRTDQYTLVDLSLRCGSTRENVIYLSRESALIFRVESLDAANYAIRLTRL